MTGIAATVALALTLTAAPAAATVADRIAACLDAAPAARHCIGQETRACVAARGDEVIAVTVPDCLEAEYRGWQALVDRWWSDAGADAAARAAHRAWFDRRERECTKPDRLHGRLPLELTLAIKWQCRRNLTAERAIALHEARS